MLRLALKIDVDTWRGTKEGVPRLMELLQRKGAHATFFLSLGPDKTGRALKRIFRPGFFSKVRRTSVLKHYGLKTLCYGTLLPGPHISRTLTPVLRGIAAAGFETGIHCWNHISWQDGVRSADEAWTEGQMNLAADAYHDLFHQAPHCHGAAGWQMNLPALRMTQKLNLSFASDSRGTSPFLPVWQKEVIRCPQWPTTLPTFDELLGLDGRSPDQVVSQLVHEAKHCPDYGHVFTLHTELEGNLFIEHFSQLLDRWQDMGYTFHSMGEMAGDVSVQQLPLHEIAYRPVLGRSGMLLYQGAPVKISEVANAVTH